MLGVSSADANTAQGRTKLTRVGISAAMR